MSNKVITTLIYPILVILCAIRMLFYVANLLVLSLRGVRRSPKPSHVAFNHINSISSMLYVVGPHATKLPRTLT